MKNIPDKAYLIIKQQLLRTWFDLKFWLHKVNRHPAIREGEVWWCNFGENIGVEMNGKNKLSLRPVVIYKKYNQHSFFGLPLTSQTYHQGGWYVHFYFQKKEQVCVLNQGRSMSVNRLYQRKGRIDEADFQMIKQRFLRLHK